MRYTNPVILSDYSDPDVIRVGDDFYMVASSFNHVPGVPVLHSKNLVQWRIINHVFDEIPFEGFDEVKHGKGAWAPSIRYHGGRFYCLIPFPDEGIFVSDTDDIYGKWSPLRPLLEGKGYEDPCPLWEGGKCYVVIGFAKSRAGFNSELAIFETDDKLTKCARKYKKVFDGHDTCPNIEGPKFLKRNGYYYISAPAGGVGTGWQVALRARNIYGPYEFKVNFVQGDSDVNGPHQGAIVDLDDDGKRWAFVHFQDMHVYGRVVHLQPVKWENDWPLLGNVRDDKLPGNPVSEGEYPVDIDTDFNIDPSDEFDGDGLKNIWQTPANRQRGWYEIKNGLKLNCVAYESNSLADMPQLFAQKVSYLSFNIKAKCRLNLLCDGDETGLVMFGRSYAYICAVRKDGRNYVEIRQGKIGGGDDETLCQSQPWDDDYVTFQLSARYEERHKLAFRLSFNGGAFTHKFYAERGVWVGAKTGLYAKSQAGSKGYATYKFFRVADMTKKKN